MTQSTGNARNILVGASPLFLTVDDSTTLGYKDDMPAGTSSAGTALGIGDTTGPATLVPSFSGSASYITTLNTGTVVEGGGGGTSAAAYRNVGYTNGGLSITYNPSYGAVTVDQLLDSAKLFKESMAVSIATELAEGTLQNILIVFGQSGDTLNGSTLGLDAGALGEAPTERQLIAVGQAPTTDSPKSERVYYARRVLSVEQSQFQLARGAASTFPVTFRLLPSGATGHANKEYGTIVDRTWS